MRQIKWHCSYLSIIVLFFSYSLHAEEKTKLTYRWVFVQNKLLSDKNVNQLQNVLKIASAHGFNGIVLSACLDKLEFQSDAYFKNLKKIKQLCVENQIDIIPCVFSIGYGGSILRFDKNLAVGFPVKNSYYKVVEVSKKKRNLISNGGFEEYSKNKAYDYRFNDDPGKISFIDKEEFHSGEASIRFENFSYSEHGHGRLSQEVNILANHNYSLSCWVKSKNLVPNTMSIKVLSRDMEPLTVKKIPVKQTNDWAQVSLTFNPQNNKRIRIYIGIWGGIDGKFWLDDILLKSISMDNKNDKELIAIPNPEFDCMVINGGFEQYNKNNPKGYIFIDRPGETSFIDKSEFYSGHASLKFENFQSDEKGHGRVCQEVEVQQFKQFSLTCYIKTKSLDPADNIMMQVYSADMKNVLGKKKVEIAPTNDWTKISTLFNSKAHTRIRFYIGVWNGSTGKFWIDNIAIKQEGMLNLLRRNGTPLEVKNARTGEKYIEEEDFEQVLDHNLSFKKDHSAPVIKIKPEGKIGLGDTLIVNFYHGLSWDNKQVSICMSEPKVYEILEKQAKLLHNLLQPKYYLFSMDEIRQGGTDRSDRERGMSMAEILGDCVTKQYNTIKRLNPKAKIFLWSDMFDPNHNAKKNYCQVEGDFCGSWEYIPKDIIMVCWNHKKPEETIAHFKENGFQALLAAYYDADTLVASRTGKEILQKYDNSAGIMYTTWKKNYNLLKEFGDMINE